MSDLPFHENEYVVFASVNIDTDSSIKHESMPYYRRVRMHPTEVSALVKAIKEAFDRMYEARGGAA
jgi:hypothetical protein